VETRRQPFAVVMPALNEERTVGQVVRDCRRDFPQATVIVVSDGSSDDTAACARKNGALVLELPCRLGVGPAVQTGLQKAVELGFSRVVRMDSDGQHLSSQIGALLDKMDGENLDFVVGSRFLPGSSFEAGSTQARRFGNRALAKVLSLVCKTRITDPTSGMWCARGGLLRFFSHRYPAEYPEPEAIALLRRQGYEMAEVPITVMPRTAGVSSIKPLSLPYFAMRVGLALLADRVRPIERRFAKNSRPAPVA
jgi:glycosyltransferase involved in cell wall biosynthesis